MLRSPMAPAGLGRARQSLGYAVDNHDQTVLHRHSRASTGAVALKDQHW